MNRHLRVGALSVAVLIAAALPAAAGGLLVVENKSDHDIKVAAPGGRGSVPKGAEPVEIQFDTDKPSVEVKVWFKSNPRQLCVIFTPFERRLVVSGKREILCLTKNL